MSFCDGGLTCIRVWMTSCWRQCTSVVWNKIDFFLLETPERFKWNSVEALATPLNASHIVKNYSLDWPLLCRKLLGKRRVQSCLPARHIFRKAPLLWYNLPCSAENDTQQLNIKVTVWMKTKQILSKIYITLIARSEYSTF